MGPPKKFHKSKINAKKSKKVRGLKSKLEKTLEMDLVESRDNVEMELAKVRPVYTKILKRKDELREKKEKAPQTPKTVKNPLNPLGETRSQLKDRVRGKRRLNHVAGEIGPAGPGVVRRAKEIKNESTASRLVRISFLFKFKKVNKKKQKTKKNTACKNCKAPCGEERTCVRDTPDWLASLRIVHLRTRCLHLTKNGLEDLFNNQ